MGAGRRHELYKLFTVFIMNLQKFPTFGTKGAYVSMLVGVLLLLNERRGVT